MRKTSFNNTAYCKNNCHNIDKKGVKFYENVFTVSMKGRVILCPYNFSVYIKKMKIISSLVFSDASRYRKLKYSFKHSLKKGEEYSTIISTVFESEKLLEGVRFNFEHIFHDLRNHVTCLLNKIDFILFERTNFAELQLLQKAKVEIVDCRDKWFNSKYNDLGVAYKEDEFLNVFQSSIELNNINRLITVIRRQSYLMRLNTISKQFIALEKVVSEFINSGKSSDQVLLKIKGFRNEIEFVNHIVRSHNKYIDVLERKYITSSEVCMFAHSKGAV